MIHDTIVSYETINYILTFLTLAIVEHGTALLFSDLLDL